MKVLTERIQPLKELTQYVFKRFELITNGLTEKKIEWSPMEESNNMRWILTHISIIINLYIPQTIHRDPSFYPKNWPLDYHKSSHSLENLLCDINNGKKIFIEDLEKLTTNDFEVMVPRRDSTRTMQWCLIHYLSEISHHTGQIAYLRGTINRLRKKEEGFT